MNHTIVSQWMQHPVVELDPDADVGFALGAARVLRSHYFPLSRGGKLFGIVCTCDLDDAPRGQPISELAHHDVVTVSRRASLAEAAKLMHDHVIGSLVVVEAGAVCGILTREDLVRAGAEWTAYFDDQRCQACGALKHLRPGAAGGLLCCSCLGRAHDHGEWLETGEAD